LAARRIRGKESSVKDQHYPVCEKLLASMKPFRVLNPLHPNQHVLGLCALALMTKAPLAGRVKTRLVPPLTPGEAAELNKCFLSDTAATISSVSPKKDACAIAVYTPLGAESAYFDILPPDFSLLAQRGSAFGQRLYFAAVDLFKCGFESVCLIDSDSPTVPAENFVQAVKLLSSPGDRIVLGPCDDGGYYLIGLKKPHREVFGQIDWSTERVLAQTRQRAREIHLEVKLLPPGYDVDDGASLKRLCQELLADTASADIAPHTRKFLRKLTTQKRL
jgi:rSAM/selenodomain-associated transferase 1